MANMCASCTAEYARYEELKKQLKDAQEKARTARDDAIKIQSDFSNVVIDGSPVGTEELNNCITNFTSTISKLQTAYQQCLTKLNSIVCTHLDVEEDDNTIARTYYR